MIHAVFFSLAFGLLLSANDYYLLKLTDLLTLLLISLLYASGVLICKDIYRLVILSETK